MLLWDTDALSTCRKVAATAGKCCPGKHVTKGVPVSMLWHAFHHFMKGDVRGSEPMVLVGLDCRLQVEDAALLGIGCPELDQAALRELYALDNAQREGPASQVPLQVPSEIVSCIQHNNKILIALYLNFHEHDSKGGLMPRHQ